MNARAHILVKGKVQGVFFRGLAKRKAEGLNVKGWVRNLADGRVEAVFEGEEKAVKSLVEYCRHGPQGAVITNVDLKWENFTGEFKKFEIKY